jgi:hypothetical protein
VPARSEVWTVFTRSNILTVGSNPIQSMNVCVYFVFVLVAAFRRAIPPSKESYRLSLDLETEVKHSVSLMPYASKWKQQEERKKESWLNKME